MTPEQMERAIEFLLNSQAQNTADIGRLTAEVQGLKELQAQTSRDVITVAATVSDLANTVARVEAQAESNRLEIREAIENLIIASEATRKFSEDIARLEVQTSRRVTNQGKEIAALIEQGKETNARIAALSEQGKETNARITALSEQGKETDARIAALSEQGKETNARIAALSEQGKETDARIAALSEQGKETDARLNVLISIVERHITNATAHEREE